MYDELNELHTVDETSIDVVEEINIDLDKKKKEIVDTEVKKNWVHHNARTEHQVAVEALKKVKAMERKQEITKKRVVEHIRGGYVIKYV